MPIFKPDRGYTELIPYYYCSECFDMLEYNTMTYDFDTLKYWDWCINCEYNTEIYPYNYTGSGVEYRMCQSDKYYSEYMNNYDVQDSCDREPF